MARSRLTNTTDDLITDSGAVLWSIVRGEQLEYLVTLNFIEKDTHLYTFEAVVIEAQNEEGQTESPRAVRPGGVVEQVLVRVPTFRGNWDVAQAYNREDVVIYAGTFYKQLSGVAITNSTPPNLSTNWEATDINKVYLQFLKTIGSTWLVKPTIDSPVYGFFELRVTEPTDSIFRRTWKPVRGMLELLFSPTYSVDD